MVERISAWDSLINDPPPGPPGPGKFPRWLILVIAALAVPFLLTSWLKTFASPEGGLVALLLLAPIVFFFERSIFINDKEEWAYPVISFPPILWRMPGPENGRFVSVGLCQGINAKIYGPGWHFSPLIKLYAKIERFGPAKVPNDKIGIVTALDGKVLEPGQIIARHVECRNFADAEAFLVSGGQKGDQLRYLPPGTYPGIHPKLFEVRNENMLTITPREAIRRNDDGTETNELVKRIGIVTARVGKEIPEGRLIANPPTTPHNNFQDPVAFLEGGGERGIQRNVIELGTFHIHPMFKVDVVDAVKIGPAQVGVVVSHEGDEPSQDELLKVGEEMAHDTDGRELRKPICILMPGVKNKRGIMSEPLGTGDHNLNPLAKEIVSTVDISQITVDVPDLTVVTKEPFYFPAKGKVVFAIPPSDAPKMVALSGSLKQLINDVIRPNVESLIRDEGSRRPVCDFIENRDQVQDAIRDLLHERISPYYTRIISFNFVDVDFAASKDAAFSRFLSLRTDKINFENEKQVITIRTEAEEVRKLLAKKTAIANIQNDIVRARVAKQIARFVKHATEIKSEALSKIVKDLPGESPTIKAFEMLLSDPNGLTHAMQIIEKIATLFTSAPGPKTD